MVVRGRPRLHPRGLGPRRRAPTFRRLGKPNRLVHIQMSWLKAVHRNALCPTANVHHKVLYPRL